MAKSNLILALGKLLIAVAWADRTITDDEINSLKDLLFYLPDLTGREWASLEMYIHSPVGAEERERLLHQFLSELQTPADKELALSALDHMMDMDPEAGDEELVVLEDIKAAIESEHVGFLKMLGRAVSDSVSRRQTALAGAPNREQHFEDFIKNKVFYSLQRMLAAGEAEMDIPEERLRLLCLAGGLMARVAHVDEEVTSIETEAMIAAFQERLSVSRQEAAFIVAVAISEVSPKMDYYRLTREFFEGTNEKDRLDFLDALFAIAAADEGASHQEIEEIRSIARGLRLTHKQFIAAKLKIPRSQRAN